jgi:hypothetical protein
MKTIQMYGGLRFKMELPPPQIPIEEVPPPRNIILPLFDRPGIFCRPLVERCERRTCAYYLRRLGHSPTILEALPKLGGALQYGIPEYRLPKEILDWEIEGILSVGIEARVNTVP